MKQYRVVILLNILVSNFKQFITARIKRTLFNKCFNRTKNHIATYKFIIVHDPTLLLFSLRNMGIEHKRHTQLRFATEGAQGALLGRQEGTCLPSSACPDI